MLIGDPAQPIKPSLFAVLPFLTHRLQSHFGYVCNFSINPLYSCWLACNLCTELK
uniref:Uncharacterized protein n=1 Tax=Anguilla anguilla TaxID=7936 RepID=A0A0E9WJI8_ANGAN